MKFDSMYHIEYGFFFKERFLGAMKSVKPSALESEVFEPYNSGSSSKFIVKKTEYSDKDVIQDLLQKYSLRDVVSYGFTLENGVLKETIKNQSNLKQPTYVLTTHLTPSSQDLFLKNIFKYFGVYLALFVKDHEYHLTDQTYVLTELKDILENHSDYSTSCGDYTFIYEKDKLGSPDSAFLGISSKFEANTMNELDKRKGISLFLYLDDDTKTREYQNNFVVNEETFKRFINISTEDVAICQSVLNSLLHEKKELDLLYQCNLDFSQLLS